MFVRRRPCKEIPLLGEMSAEQTKGCPFSEKKLASVSEAEGFVAKQHNGFCAVLRDAKRIPYKHDTSTIYSQVSINGGSKPPPYRA